MINEQFVIDYLAYKAGRPLKVRELARALAIPDRDYTGFRIMIKKLTDAGKLIILKSHRLGVPAALNLVVGNISISKGGYGTITTESGEPVVILPDDTLTALDGDKVMVRIGTGPEDELTGKVIKVMERSPRDIVEYSEPRKISAMSFLTIENPP